MTKLTEARDLERAQEVVAAFCDERVANMSDREALRLSALITAALAAVRTEGFKAVINQTAPGWHQLCTAFRMVEDAIQELGPAGALRSTDTQGSPPDPISDAERIIEDIKRIEDVARAEGFSDGWDAAVKMLRDRLVEIDHAPAPDDEAATNVAMHSVIGRRCADFLATNKPKDGTP